MALGALEVVEWTVALMVVRGGPRPRPDSATIGSGGATGWEDGPRSGATAGPARRW